MNQSPLGPELEGASRNQAASSSELIVIGRTVAEARQAHGLSADELAQKLGISTEFLQALEVADGRRLPALAITITQIRRLAGHLNVDLEGPIQALRRALVIGSAHMAPASTVVDLSRNSAGVASLSSPTELATDLLPKLDLEEYVPSVKPWLRIGSVAVLISAGATVAFMAVCPYRVVIRSQGVVRPAGDQVVVNAPFEGRVVALAVRSNQAIDVGQPILTLDPSRLQGAAQQLGKTSSALAEQVLAAQHQTASEEARARLEVEKNQAALAFAQSEFNRYQGLAQQGAAAQSMFEAKLAERNQARSQLQQAREGLDAVRSQGRQREAELRKELAGMEQSSDETRRNLLNTVVRSPVRGVVFQLLVRSPQQTVGAGEQLATITPSTAERMIKTIVRSEDVETVRVGQRADLRLAGCPYPDFGTLTARVVAVSPDALPESNGYEVTLKPQNIWLSSRTRRCEVKIGMPVVADIRTKEETILRFVLRKMRLLVG